MMRVDLEKCTGCGKCLEVCPAEAISMVDGRAAIDVDACLMCEDCAQVCPQGAISESRFLVPQPIRSEAGLNPVILPENPAIVVQDGNRRSWVAPVLSFMGKEILPRLADSLVAALDRRLSETTKPQAVIYPGNTIQNTGRMRQVRRRRRGKNF